MARIVCYEAFPNAKNIGRMRRVLVNRHGFTEKTNQHGSYFYLETSSMDAWQIQTILKFHQYKYRAYDKRYERSSSYRKEFFEHNKGPYHCAYCGRRLRIELIEVDHLIPVSKAKSNVGVRTWLQLCGVADVNDHKNLVASCKKCNRKKSDHMGFWIFRGMIGRFRIVWTIRNILVVFLLIIALLILNNYFPIVETVKNLISNIF
jgi:hypothetical protein